MLCYQDQKEFFMAAYAECNEHARAQPKSRDQVILFYSAVCAFYLSQITFLSPIMFWALTSAMFILGVICSLIVINFRSWIIQYGKAAEVLGHLLASPQKFSTMDEVAEFIHIDCVSAFRPKSHFLLRLGNLIVIGFFFITTAPFAAVCNCLWGVNQAFAVISALCALPYFLILVFICYRKILKAENMNDETWIIRFSCITESHSDHP